MRITITLIRHGETEANAAHRYLGQTEESLSITGKKKLAKRKEYFESPDLLLCSPMLRCRESAEILFPDMTPVSVPEWKEIDFGIFEGKTYQELNGISIYQAWIDSGGMLQIPNGESRAQFCQRVLAGFAKCRKLFWEESRISCVVHGGTIMALLSNWTGKDYYDFQVKNGEGFCCRLELTEENVEVLALKKLEDGNK